MYILPINQFDALLKSLKKRGFSLAGPKLIDEAIMYEEIGSFADLPVGVHDNQERGHYEVKQSKDKSLFGYALGPSSWKKFLFPPRKKLLGISKNCDFQQEKEPAKKFAFIGIRPCELKAIAIQDKVFLSPSHPDPFYQKMRKDLFFVAVNCTSPAKTCFCTSMGTGPQADDGYDIALTEIHTRETHYFCLETGSKRGEEVVKALSLKEAKKEEKKTAKSFMKKASRKITRKVDNTNIKELFYKNYENPHWDDIAKRCMACGNCTMVCPTCFCSTVEDITDLKGESAERWRLWDSCFNGDFSYIHGGNVRESIKSKYRQWLTHKFAAWWDQFQTSGCVGCGRCITWCPVGIDVTEEVQALREKDK